MRYKEPRDQSAELLRLALAEMGRHDAAFTPINFTVWYEHVAGINPRLSQAIVHQLGVEPRFSDETVQRLHREHIAELDGAKAERISDQFQRVMKGMADAASDTGEAAGQFGAQLGEFAVAMRDSDQAALAAWLEAVQAGTDRMRTSADALKAQVARSQTEIDALRADLERARADATLCPLSRVLNRKGFDQRLEAMLATPPSGGHTHGLIMVDIDHFKQVNDTHGHLMGDRVIQALGEVLRATVIQPGAVGARYGGEEFAVLLPLTTPDDCRQLAEQVRARTKAMKVRNRSTNEVLLTVTVSAGVAMSRPDDDPASLISRADAALYRSKQAGRDRVTVAG